MRYVLGLALLVSACGAEPEVPATAARTNAADIATTVAVSLPDEPATPWTGAGGALIERNCAACHSAEMIANQPKLGAEKWQATIDKMRTVYRARIDPAQDAAMIAALQAH